VSETDSTIAPPPPPALELEVHGRPIPKGAVSAFVVPGKSGKRARAVVVQGGSKSRRSALNEWQSAIQDAALVAMGARELEIARFAGVAVAVEITFRLGRPKSHYGTGRNAGKLKPDAPSFPIGTPDVDKLARAALDALIGTAFDDDSRVVDLHPRKVYAYAGDTEGAWIRIRAASELALVRPNVPILSIVPDTLRAQGGAGTLGELLGLKPAWSVDKDWTLLADSGGGLLALIQKGHRRHRPHLGFLVSSRKRVDQVYARVQKTKLKSSAPESHRDGSYGFYFTDLDGNHFEILYFPKSTKKKL